MAEIVSLADVRRRRAEQRRAAAEHAIMHPALRWNCEGHDYAHRRTRAGSTVCGLPGPLTLADASQRLCRECYTVRVAATP